MKNLNAQLDAILLKHKDIEKKLSQQDVLETNKLIELNKEYSELTPIVEVISEFNQNKQELMDRGGFGSPTFFVEETDMYFGNDRVQLINELL